MAYFRTEGYVSEWTAPGAPGAEPNPGPSLQVSAMRKGGVGAVYLFAQYLKDRVDAQGDDAAKVRELSRVLDVLLVDHLLVVQVVSDTEVPVPG